MRRFLPENFGHERGKIKMKRKKLSEVLHIKKTILTFAPLLRSKGATKKEILPL